MVRRAAILPGILAGRDGLPKGATEAMPRSGCSVKLRGSVAGPVHGPTAAISGACCKVVVKLPCRNRWGKPGCPVVSGQAGSPRANSAAQWLAHQENEAG
jgi:hypothetical protein